MKWGQPQNGLFQNPNVKQCKSLWLTSFPSVYLYQLLLSWTEPGAGTFFCFTTVPVLSCRATNDEPPPISAWSPALGLLLAQGLFWWMRWEERCIGLPIREITVPVTRYNKWQDVFESEDCPTEKTMTGNVLLLPDDVTFVVFLKIIQFLPF